MLDRRFSFLGQFSRAILGIDAGRGGKESIIRWFTISIDRFSRDGVGGQCDRPTCAAIIQL
jgi:hypothetical protein